MFLHDVSLFFTIFLFCYHLSCYHCDDCSLFHVLSSFFQYFHAFSFSSVMFHGFPESVSLSFIIHILSSFPSLLIMFILFSSLIASHCQINVAEESTYCFLIFVQVLQLGGGLRPPNPPNPPPPPRHFTQHIHACFIMFYHVSSFIIKIIFSLCHHVSSFILSIIAHYCSFSYVSYFIVVMIFMIFHYLHHFSLLAWFFMIFHFHVSRFSIFINIAMLFPSSSSRFLFPSLSMYHHYHHYHHYPDVNENVFFLMLAFCSGPTKSTITQASMIFCFCCLPFVLAPIKFSTFFLMLKTFFFDALGICFFDA